MQTTSCRSMFGFMFLRVVPGIRNHVRASCMAIINTNSKSKRKDDIGVIFHILASFSCISVFGAVAIPGWRVSLTNGYHWGSLLVMNFPVCIATVSFIMVADLQAGITLCFFPIKHTGHRRGSCQLHHFTSPVSSSSGTLLGMGGNGIRGDGGDPRAQSPRLLKRESISWSQILLSLGAGPLCLLPRSPLERSSNNSFVLF